MHLYNVSESSWRTIPLHKCLLESLGAIDKETPGPKVYLLDMRAIVAFLLSPGIETAEKKVTANFSGISISWKRFPSEAQWEILELSKVAESYLLLKATTKNFQYVFQGGEVRAFCLTADF